MRKRNNFILFMVLLCTTSCLSAQNTGYMGKRIVFNMGAEFSPAWFRPACDINFKNRYLRFNTILSPSVEIITSQRGTLGLVYHYLGTKYNTPLKEHEYGGIIYLDSVYEDELPVVEDLKAHGFGIFYKAYLGNGRSPTGTYLKAQFDGFFYKCPSSYEDRTTKISDQLFAMKIEFGNDFLLFNRLRLSTGLSFGLPFGGFKGLGYDNPWMITEIFNWNEEDLELRQYARSRIFGAYWIGFTVNIGFLAF